MAKEVRMPPIKKFDSISSAFNSFSIIKIKLAVIIFAIKPLVISLEVKSFDTLKRLIIFGIPVKPQNIIHKGINNKAQKL
tara:strand:+ start:214 stop:453 length:240 start_codon:yes stop_codon:yes gene_type:complete